MFVKGCNSLIRVGSNDWLICLGYTCATYACASRLNKAGKMPVYDVRHLQASMQSLKSYEKILIRTFGEGDFGVQESMHLL